MPGPKGNKIYFNDAQRRVQLIGARTTCILAGRRTGKTDSIASPFVLRNMQRMPGSGGGILVPTYKHGLTNTIPGMLAAWERWGFHEGLHYVVGKKPPKFFKAPIIKPQENAHVIHFYNGSVAYILSQDRSFVANSLTLSWLLIDEARFIDYQKYINETKPALGGIRSYFGARSCWNSQMILSDMPQTQKGSWMLAYKDKMDPELIQTIEGSVYEHWNVRARIQEMKRKGVEIPTYLRDYLRTLDRNLNRLRSVAVYYKEYSSIENIALLGEDYIRQMKRDLTPKTFQTSILCRRLGIAKDGFYSSMKETHKYDASDLQYLEERFFQNDFSDRMDSRSDADVDPTQPICIGMDYNANINWIVAGQPDHSRRRLNVIKSFYTKYERKIPELIRDFCTYYAFHPTKRVIYYYDSTALGSNYAVNDRDFHFVVRSEFERCGWQVESVYLGQPMRHHEKYLLINEGFAGRNNLTPYFNRQNNEDLIIAIQTAEVERGRNGFRKNKSGEKLQETEENLLELRTDGTDAFDTLYIGCERFPRTTPAIIFASGIA